MTNPTSVLLLGPNNFYFKFPTIIGHNGRCPDTDCGITVANVSAPRADYGS